MANAVDLLDELKTMIETRKSFPKHEGRPGKVGGSLPKGQGMVRRPNPPISMDDMYRRSGITRADIEEREKRYGTKFILRSYDDFLKDRDEHVSKIAVVTAAGRGYSMGRSLGSADYLPMLYHIPSKTVIYNFDCGTHWTLAANAFPETEGEDMAEKFADECVHFYWIREKGKPQLQFSNSYAGVVLLKDEDDVNRAANNIYDAMDQLSILGFPSKLPVAISVYEPEGRGIAKMEVTLKSFGGGTMNEQKLKDFPKHHGRPGRKGGSLPKGQGSAVHRPNPPTGTAKVSAASENPTVIDLKQQADSALDELRQRTAPEQPVEFLKPSTLGKFHMDQSAAEQQITDAVQKLDAITSASHVYALSRYPSGKLEGISLIHLPEGNYFHVSGTRVPVIAVTDRNLSPAELESLGATVNKITGPTSNVLADFAAGKGWTADEIVRRLSKVDDKTRRQTLSMTGQRYGVSLDEITREYNKLAAKIQQEGERLKAFPGHKGRPGQLGGSLAKGQSGTVIKPAGVGVPSAKPAGVLAPIAKVIGKKPATKLTAININHVPTLYGKTIDLTKVDPSKLITKPTQVIGPDGKPIQANSYGAGPQDRMIEIAKALSQIDHITYSVVQSVDNSQMHHIVREAELKMLNAQYSGGVVDYLRAQRQRDLAKRLGGKVIRRVAASYSGKSMEGIVSGLRRLLVGCKDFEKHEGRPGKVGGSLPKGQTHGTIVKSPNPPIGLKKTFSQIVQRIPMTGATAIPYNEQQDDPIPYNAMSGVAEKKFMAIMKGRPKAAQALKDYIDGGYTVNETLRHPEKSDDGTKDYAAAQVVQLDAAVMAGFVEAGDPLLLYRATSGGKGKEFIDKGYASCTGSKEIADSFVERFGGKVQTIVVPSLTRVAWASQVSGNDEQEVLLPRGCKFRAMQLETEEGMQKAWLAIAPGSKDW